MCPPTVDLRPLFQPYLLGFLVGFEGDLVQQIEFKEQVHDGSSLYLSPVQAWIEGAYERSPSPWQGFEGSQVHDLFYCSNTIPMKLNDVYSTHH